MLYQHHHCQVTQPLLLEQLHEIGIDISKGQLSNILIENKDRYHKEKDSILAVGLQDSSYINVDDTGARHKGKNGYCTHIGNESFSWFESTESKSRHVQIATEGTLIGSIIEHGISKNLVIISDDAGQFNVLLHALCWIHANRAIDKIIPFTDQAKKDLDTVKDHVWLLYKGLKKYKEHPKLKDKKRLENMFDQIFTTKTASATLNAALQRIYNNKSELPLVLDRPDIPLHNNISENALRDYVKRRKISGSTRSESGRQCRDTFTSLKKTCRKLGVSFWQYLKDRIENTGLIPDLSDLIRQQALNPG